jgi:hypothetical protein
MKKGIAFFITYLLSFLWQHVSGITTTTAIKLPLGEIMDEAEYR